MATKEKQEYLVVPTLGHNNRSVLEAVMVIHGNTTKLFDKYPDSDFYKNIIADCNTILDGGRCPEGIKGIPITPAMKPYLLKAKPDNECFKAIVPLDLD